VERRLFVKSLAGTVAAAGAACVGYAVGIEPQWLDITMRELAIESLPPNLDGAHVAQISDIHVGPNVSDEYLIKSFDRVRALGCDIVLFTGDFITHRASRGETQFRQLRSVLARFPRGRLATLGILGNHDYGIGWNQPAVAARVVAEAERAGIHVLRNETQNVGGLDVIGVDDLWARQSDVPRAVSKRSSDAAVVLVHNPDAADKLRWGDYRGWMLAGHTHGGQCKPPFLPPPLLPVENRRYVAGEVRVDGDRTLYISRGVGYLIRARFDVRPEITIFTLRRAMPAQSA
jgi:hypothetical protein